MAQSKRGDSGDEAAARAEHRVSAGDGAALGVTETLSSAQRPGARRGRGRGPAWGGLSGGSGRQRQESWEAAGGRRPVSPPRLGAPAGRRQERGRWTPGALQVEFCVKTPPRPVVCTVALW